MRFAQITGIKQKISDVAFSLLPHVGLPAFAVTGSEDDELYEWWAKVKLVDCDTAGLVASFLEEEGTAYKQSYVEFRVDFANQKVGLYLIIETEQDVPKEVRQRAWKVEQNVEYLLCLRINKDSDGDYYAQCFLDDAEVFDRFEYLETKFWRGLVGARVEGPNGTRAEFSDCFKGAFGSRDFVAELLKVTKLTTQSISFEDAWVLAGKAISTVESELNVGLDFLTLSGDYKLLVEALAGLRFLAYVSGGASTGFSFTLGPLSVTPQNTASDLSGIAEQLQAEVDRLVAKLTATTGDFRAV